MHMLICTFVVYMQQRRVSSSKVHTKARIGCRDHLVKSVEFSCAILSIQGRYFSQKRDAVSSLKANNCRGAYWCTIHSHLVGQ